MSNTKPPQDRSNNKSSNKKRAAAVEYTGVGAPRVVAKGEGYVAAQIEAVAQKNDVPLLQDSLLADVLVNVPLGDEIPENFYFAVAEILAHVYRINDSIDSYE